MVPTKTKTPRTQLHLGAERILRIERRTTNISYHAGRVISPADFGKELVDRFGDQLERELLSEALGIPPEKTPLSPAGE